MTLVLKQDPIVLIGLRGSGKTTFGKLLAKKLKKSWIDLDQCFEKIWHQTPAQVILNEGENAFRQKEALVLKKYLDHKGIWSTGGGAVLHPFWIDHLKSKNALVLWLDGNPKCLAQRIQVQTHPILSSKAHHLQEDLAIQKRMRDPLYASLSHIKLNACTSLNALWKLFKKAYSADVPL